MVSDALLQNLGSNSNAVQQGFSARSAQINDQNKVDQAEQDRRDADIHQVIQFAADGHVDEAKYYAQQKGVRVPDEIFTNGRLAQGAALAPTFHPDDPVGAATFVHVFSTTPGDTNTRMAAAKAASGATVDKKQQNAIDLEYAKYGAKRDLDLKQNKQISDAMGGTSSPDITSGPSAGLTSPAMSSTPSSTGSSPQFADNNVQYVPPTGTPGPAMGPALSAMPNPPAAQAIVNGTPETPGQAIGMGPMQQGPGTPPPVQVPPLTGAPNLGVTGTSAPAPTDVSSAPKNPYTSILAGIENAQNIPGLDSDHRDQLNRRYDAILARSTKWDEDNQKNSLGGLVTPDNEALSGKDFIATLIDPSVRDAANAYIEGRGKPPTTRAPMYQKQGWQAAMHADPTLNEATFPVRQKALISFSSGPAGGIIGSINTMIHHGDSFDAGVQALGNGGSETINSFINPLHGGMSDSYNSSLKPVLADMTALSAEAAKTYKGQGGVASDQEINSWNKTLNPNMGPQASKAVVDNMIGTLLKGKLDGMKEQWQQAFPNDESNHYLDPESIAILQKRGIPIPDYAQGPYTPPRIGYTPDVHDAGASAPPTAPTQPAATQPGAVPSFSDPRDPAFAKLPPGASFVDAIPGSPTFGTTMTKH